jgi:hypothetical protein
MKAFYPKKFLLISLSALFLSSCSLKKIAIQVPVPPEIIIPSEIKSLVLLNRSQNANFTDISDSLVPKPFSYKTYYDIAASDSALVSAARTIFDSQRFDVVVPIQSNILREDRNTILEPLDSAYIQNTCKDFNADAVLVLENFSEKVQYRFGEIKLIDRLIWRYYHQGLFPLSMLTDDTLHWYYKTDIPYERAFKKLPSLKETLITGGIISGENIAKQIGCTWEDRRRYYFKTGKKKADAAIPLLISNKWVKASGIWALFSSSSSLYFRGKIEFNLALVSEMTGDLDMAIDWASKSLKSRPLDITQKYLRELIERKNLLDKNQFNLINK